MASQGAPWMSMVSVKRSTIGPHAARNRSRVIRRMFTRAFRPMAETRP
jgi:hypothetical protein